jgi:hypothetical protein
VRAHRVASHRHEFVVKLLNYFETLLCSDTSHQRLTEVVRIGVTHKSGEVVLDVLYNQVDAVNRRLFDVVLKHSRAFLSAKVIRHVCEVRDIKLRRIWNRSFKHGAFDTTAAKHKASLVKFFRIMVFSTVISAAFGKSRIIYAASTTDLLGSLHLTAGHLGRLFLRAGIYISPTVIPFFLLSSPLLTHPHRGPLVLLLQLVHHDRARRGRGAARLRREV